VNAESGFHQSLGYGAADGGAFASHDNTIRRFLSSISAVLQGVDLRNEWYRSSMGILHAESRQSWLGVPRRFSTECRHHVQERLLPRYRAHGLSELLSFSALKNGSRQSQMQPGYRKAQKNQALKAHREQVEQMVKGLHHMH